MAEYLSSDWDEDTGQLLLFQLPNVDEQRHTELMHPTFPGMEDDWAHAQIFAETHKSYRGDDLQGGWTRCDTMPHSAVMMYYNTDVQPPRPLGFIEFSEYAGGSFSSGAWLWPSDPEKFQPPFVMMGMTSPFEARAELLDVIGDAVRYRLAAEHELPVVPPESILDTDDTLENMDMYALIEPTPTNDDRQLTLILGKLAL